MTVDSTFEFEKRRNVPVRYDRELMSTTVKAMKRVLEIRQKRANQFIKNRLTANKAAEKERDIVQIQKNIDLVLAPTAPQRKVIMEKVEAQTQRKMDVDE